jgi:CsoR family transcriptional regulator, copper-sensing transcriptional repressor
MLPWKAESSCLGPLRIGGTYTVPGYFLHMSKGQSRGQSKTAVLNRLRRIEGQVRGVAQMIEHDRYCIDILHQIQAIKAALAKVEDEILADHTASCVQEAIASGDLAAQQEKFAELVSLFGKLKR